MYLHPGKDARMSKNEELARDLLYENPSLSIDDLARELTSKGVALHKPEISRIRHEVRASIDRAKTSLKAVEAHQRSRTSSPTVFVRKAGEAQARPVQPKAPFNPPRLVVAPSPAPEPTAVPSVVTEPSPVSQPPAGAPTVEITAEIIRPPAEPSTITVNSLLATAPEWVREGRDEKVHRPGPVPGLPTLAERKRWLEGWVLEHPNASVGKARQALREHFGMTMGTELIAEIVKIGQELHRAQYPEPEPEPVKKFDPINQIAAIAQALRDAGIKKIEMVGGHFIIEMLQPT